MNIIFNAKTISDESGSKLRELSEEEINLYSNNLESIVNQLLSISNIEMNNTYDIIVTEDFDKEVKEFQKQQGTIIGYTDFDMGKAYAKVIDFKIDGVKKIKVFLNKILIFYLVSDDVVLGLSDEEKDNFIDMRDFVIHNIHHELMHVYDEFNDNGKYEYFANQSNTLPVEKLLMSNSIVVWKEYYASRMSASTFNKDFTEEVVDLIGYVDDVEIKIKNAINQYRFHGNIDLLLDDVSNRIITILNFTSYLFGRLYKFKNHDEILEIIENVKIGLKDTFIYTIWVEMFVELNVLFNKYSNWEIEDFCNFKSMVLKAYNNLGIFPENMDQYLHISVL